MADLILQGKLTIVIPCKNEEKYIGNILSDISKQRGIAGTRIIIADAKSTDATLDIVNKYKQTLNVKIISGGLPAIGRNAGAKISETDYIVFIDSDARIYDKNMLIDSVFHMQNKDLDLLACRLNSHNFPVKILYKINNLILWLSKFDKPFAVGIYMIFKKSKFDELGGFPEDVMHCEDYLLSQKVECSRFAISNHQVYSDNRRFKKIGYIGMIRYIFMNILNRNNYDYFKKDINYWK